MSDPTRSPFVARLAELFRAEGDEATASALERQLRANDDLTLSDEEAERVRHLQRRAGDLEHNGRYEEAEASWTEALRTVESVLGPAHLQVAEHLNALARCRFNMGNLEPALQDYSRLLRLMESAYGPGDEWTQVTRHHVESCRKALRDATGAMRLQHQVDWMLRHANVVRAHAEAARRERLKALLPRLIARGRKATALRLLEQRSALRGFDFDSHDEPGLDDLRTHALALCEVGEPGRAERLLRQLVLVRNVHRAADDGAQALARALVDLAHGLDAAGAKRSAKETRALAEAVLSGHTGSRTTPGEGPAGNSGGYPALDRS